MDEIFAKSQKSLLREKIKQKQKKLSSEYILFSNNKITENIMNLNQFKNSSFIFTFVGTQNEIDTIPLITTSLSLGKRVAVPLCIEKGIMEAREIKSIDELQTGSYGIMEPKQHCSLVSPSLIDLGIIPCISCDKKGTRLGHGGGYYDRYLENSDFFTVLICREFLTSKEIPKMEHDISAKCVITEEIIVFV